MGQLFGVLDAGEVRKRPIKGCVHCKTLQSRFGRRRRRTFKPYRALSARTYRFSEMNRSFHIYLSSADSWDSFPQNHSGDFTVSLSDNVHLGEEWECGLLECQLFATPTTPAYICCDLVEESLVAEFKLPILRRIRLKTATEFQQVSYFPLKTRGFNTVRIYVRTWNNKPLYATSGQPGHTYCTLHFRRRGI